MKYCAKCGMLLEDNHDICIGCGADVTQPESYSLYPPNIQQTLQKEMVAEKKRGGTIALLVIVFVLLVAAITGFIIMNASSLNDQKINEDDVRDAVESVKEQIGDADDAALEEEPVRGTLDTDLIDGEASDAGSPGTSGTSGGASSKQVKDDKGRYYTYTTIDDPAGSTIFSTLYPEDFKPVASEVKTDVYSNKFPESVTFVVSNDDGNVQFTYLSPTQYWHRDSKKGQSRNNEYNINDYMMFLTYNKAQGYAEALIKNNYPDIKNFELVDTRTIDEDMSAGLKGFSESHSKTLAGISGDYAHIAEDASYAAMASECGADIFSYELNTKSGEIIFMDIYVPMIANTLSYASDSVNDMGNIIEWFPLGVIVYEAGNDELHDMYKDAFEMFVYNSRLSREFFYDNEQYSKEIDAAVSKEAELEKLDDVKLKKYHIDYKPDTELSDFYKGVYDFVSMRPGTAVNYSSDQISVIAPSNIKTAYFNPDKSKVFMSPDQSEYPGDEYSELAPDESHQGSDSQGE